MTSTIQAVGQAELEQLLKDSRIRNPDDNGQNWPIRSHAAKGPILVYHQGKTYIVMDKKDALYPNKKLAGKVCGWGGNWNNLADKTPADVYKRELSEEFRELDSDGKTIVRKPIEELMNTGLFRYAPLGEFFGVTPESAHGNPKIGLYLNPVTWFVGHVAGYDLADALKIPVTQINPERMQQEINRVAEFHSSELLDLDDVAAGSLAMGEPRFAWGDDYLLAETLRFMCGLKDPKIVTLPDVKMFWLGDVPANAPYADRWTTQHDFLNPIRRGDTADAHVFGGKK